MARKTRFVINRKGVREELLLATGDVPIEQEIVSRVQSVAPPGTEVFVSRTFGPEGRLVVHLFDRSVSDAGSAKGRTVQRRWKRQQLQQALNRLGGRFRKGGGRDA